MPAWSWCQQKKTEESLESLGLYNGGQGQHTVYLCWLWTRPDLTGKGFMGEDFKLVVPLDPLRPPQGTVILPAPQDSQEDTEHAMGIRGPWTQIILLLCPRQTRFVKQSSNMVVLWGPQASTGKQDALTSNNVIKCNLLSPDKIVVS